MTSQTMSLDEATLIVLKTLMIHRATFLVGDGHGGEIGTNPEYDRGIAELICLCSGLPRSHASEVARTIYILARQSAKAAPGGE